LHRLRANFPHFFIQGTDNAQGQIRVEVSHNRGEFVLLKMYLRKQKSRSGRVWIRRNRFPRVFLGFLQPGSGVKHPGQHKVPGNVRRRLLKPSPHNLLGCGKLLRDGGQNKTQAEVCRGVLPAAQIDGFAERRLGIAPTLEN
jgi:hypothetical protein